MTEERDTFTQFHKKKKEKVVNKIKRMLTTFAVISGLMWISVAAFQAISPTRLPALDIPPPGPIRSQLQIVRDLPQLEWLPNQSFKTQVAVHPYIFQNRLFIYAADSVNDLSIEIPQEKYTSLGQRFLINLGLGASPNFVRRLFKIDDESISKRLINNSTILKEIIATQEIFANKSIILVADGALHNINYQQIFPADKLVFRSFSLNIELIVNNIRKLSQALPFNPNNTTIINGIPSSAEELANIRLNRADWNNWVSRGIPEAWQNIIDKHHYTQQMGRTAADAKEALRNSANVLIIVAHSDGQTIFFPDGSSLTISDLETFREEIQRNRPIVFLFSCETAQVKDGLMPISQALISLGAAAVVAPVSIISADPAKNTLLDKVLQNSASGNLPIEAIQKAIQETKFRELENWIGYNFELNPSEESG